MDGVLVIDKPVGYTSHDVVARVRRILNEKRVGHTGTLDPFATGVLVVLIGRATRLAQFVNGAEKEYEGVIRFGYATDTGDSTGSMRPETKASLTSREFAQEWDENTIEEALITLRGRISQLPPMYSAKKVQGRRLYDLARKGEVIERESVEVTVHELEAVKTAGELLEHNADGTCEFAVRVVCSAGTYIRTLAESVGERLGVAAHLSTLRRTRAGEFHINDAQTLTQLEQEVALNGEVGSVLLPLNTVLSKMTARLFEDEVASRVRHGATVAAEVGLHDGELVQMCDSTGKLIAVGVYDHEQKSLRPRVVLANDE